MNVEALLARASSGVDRGAGKQRLGAFLLIEAEARASSASTFTLASIIEAVFDIPTNVDRGAGKQRLYIHANRHY